MAVEGGHKDIVEILHRNKADVNVQGYDGSALQLAGHMGFTEIAQLLQSYDAKYLGPLEDSKLDLTDTLNSDDLVDSHDET